MAACIWAVTNVSGNSQSAEIFEKASDVTEQTTDGNAQKKLPAPGPVDSQPSRFAGQDVEPYILARSAVFSMRNRPTDPFGLFQDPNAKQVIRQQIANLPSKRQTALPPVPLADIVKLIPVSTIMPGERKFLVGVRSFSEGDEFPMIFQSKRMLMKILKVDARRILFLNVETGDKASLEAGILPPGMIAGGDKMKPPGMVSPDENLPLNLEFERPINN